MLAGRMLACGPPLCADMTLYDGITDNPMQVIPFHPTPMVLGALMWKRWIVQFGSFDISVGEVSVIGRSTVSR